MTAGVLCVEQAFAHVCRLRRWVLRQTLVSSCMAFLAVADKIGTRAEALRKGSIRERLSGGAASMIGGHPVCMHYAVCTVVN